MRQPGTAFTDAVGKPKTKWPLAGGPPPAPPELTPGGRGRPAGQPCYAVPAAPAQGGAVPPAAAGAGARRRPGTSPPGDIIRNDSGKPVLRHPHPAIPSLLPSPPGADGASPAGQVAARSPPSPSGTAPARPRRSAGEGEREDATPCPVALLAPLPYLSTPDAPLRSPQPRGGGPCRWEQARRAAPSPLRAQPLPNRSARRGPAGAATAAVAVAEGAAVVRPVPAWGIAARQVRHTPLRCRRLPHRHRGPPGPSVPCVSPRSWPVGTGSSLRAIHALARGLPDPLSPVRWHRCWLLAAASCPQGEGWWPPVARVGGWGYPQRPHRGRDHQSTRT